MLLKFYSLFVPVASNRVFKWPFYISIYLLIFSDPAKSHKLNLAFVRFPCLSAFPDSISS